MDALNQRREKRGEPLLEFTDTALEAKLFVNAGAKQGHRRSREPAEVHRALKRKHVTLSIVWKEYIVREPNGYRYSRFCEPSCGWEGRLTVTMRPEPRARREAEDPMPGRAVAASAIDWV